MVKVVEVVEPLKRYRAGGGEFRVEGGKERKRQQEMKKSMNENRLVSVEVLCCSAT